MKMIVRDWEPKPGVSEDRGLLNAARVRVRAKDDVFRNNRGALTEDELERSETKGTAVTADLNEASERDQRINKAIKTLEHKNMIDEERIDLMENQVKEAKQMVEESDIKYDEVARKLAMVEGDLERAEERANAGENKARNFLI